jgi:hypothetical protein
MPNIRLLAGALAASIAALFSGASSADPVLPEISQTGVYRTDVVAASQGARVIGSPELAIRNSTTVHYLATNDAHQRYENDAKAYPDIEQGVSLGLMGADPVLRFPNGVREPAIGAIVAGDPTKYVAEHKGAWFAFATEATFRAFKNDPGRYTPDVGGYCLGAMSRKGITPGDPRNIFFVPEERQWAVYGSPNGPEAWARMTAEERTAALASAHAYYAGRIARGAQ